MKLTITPNQISFQSKIINPKKLQFPIILILFIVSIFISKPLISQPSGGPYGPIQQDYKIPGNAQNIYYVAPTGTPESNGKSISDPSSLESVFKRIKSGDIIILRGGTYRTGNLIFNQSITMQPYQNELPIFKGTKVAKDWTNLGNGLWTTTWKELFPSKPADWWRRHREGKITPLHRFNNDMVFVNGKFLQSAGWEGEVDENSFHIDYETGTVYIGVDPSDKLIEITAFNSALIRTIKDVNGIVSDKKGPILRGIIFTQYAYRAIEIEGKEPEGLSKESEFGKDVIGTTIENCTISYCSRVAAYLRGDKLTIRNCLISDTSTEGLYIISSSDVLLEKNILRRNNIEEITGYYPAAVKIFNQSYRVTCNDNLVIEQPFSNGIWYDVGNVDGVFTNNWIEGVGFTNTIVNKNQVWPSQNGFFFEISKGAVCTGNVFINCDHGIMILNSSNVEIYNNTFINSMAVVGRNERSAQGDHFGWHPSTGPDVDERIGHIFKNNLLTADDFFYRPLLFVWQPNLLCESVTEQPMKEFDNNIFVRNSNTNKTPLIYWSPIKGENCQVAFNTLEELKKVLPQYGKFSKYYENYNGYLFKSAELNHFELLKKFPSAEEGVSIPSNISKYLNESGSYVGAYKPVD
ncbi:MAG: right-handed parallel beta-helix repeat-containing protein [Melioribacteraceae bacterium]|nr:right-handed parallel beta-helix repeat-containing protein [Melioribacteraceae bacterium]